jgi:hypothetical protein
LMVLATVMNAAEYRPEMADTFRDEGKIYVVVAVIGIIFLSLLIFLVYLERKMNRIEKQIDKQIKH